MLIDFLIQLFTGLAQLSHKLNDNQLQAIKSLSTVNNQDLHTYMYDITLILNLNGIMKMFFSHFVIDCNRLLHTMRTQHGKELFSPTIPGMNQSVMSDVEKEMSEKVANTMKKAFWAMFTAELEKNPPHLTIVIF
jgi:hypothetical protein